MDHAGIEHLKDRPWEDPDFGVPNEVTSVPGMLMGQELRMLYYLSSRIWSGQGAVLDMGAFLGSSSFALAAGLAARGVDRPTLHSYDTFRLGPFERDAVANLLPDEVPADGWTRPLYDAHLAPYSHLLTVHEGDVVDFPWQGGPIEILFVDLAKAYYVFDHLVASYFPALIPIRSVVVLQDYLFAWSGPWHAVVMERLAEYFEYVGDTEISSMIFRLVKPIPAEELAASQWEAIPLGEKHALMERAIARLDTEEKREIVREAQVNWFGG